MGLRLSRRRWLVIVAGGLILVLAAAGALLVNRSPTIRVANQFVTGVPEADGKPVQLDTTLYLPATTPAPAVLLAHGFGGGKRDLDGQARDLARHGYVVLAYTARGFGSSGGSIHLDSQQFEVKDASRLLDFLQTRSEVSRRDGHPVVGVAGSSYGGALALMLGATDHRIGAVAADITWNDLARSLFPNDSSDSGGVFKKLWAGYLFSAGFAPVTGTPQLGTSACGRFAPDLCQLYQRAAAGNPLDSRFTRLLLGSSPSTVLGGMQAPTLLTQGEQDSLFTLREADASARQIAKAGAEVQVRWRSGGHDAPAAGDDVAGWQRAFFDQKLRGEGSGTSGQFLLTQRGASISAANGRRVNTVLKATDGYPDLDHQRTGTDPSLPLQGGEQSISAPAGGAPAAVSSIPGLGDLLGTAADAGVSAGVGLDRIPGQVAVFRTEPLSETKLITGSARVWLSLRSDAVRGVTLFVALHDIGPDGSDVLPARLVAPVHLAPRPDATKPVATVIDLPWIVAQVPSGHRLAVVVSTTDFAYAMPTQPATYGVALDSQHPGLSVPSFAVSPIRGGGPLNWVIVAGFVVLSCLGYAWWRLRSQRAHEADDTLAEVPIVITDLVKKYSDGYRAVDGVSLRVQRGEVLGLLGPNGAGKTTTLRVLMGLILPTSGSIRVFGEEVVPGAAVLSRLGAFVEGPGFLPHLSGRDNLRLYWGASGRVAEQAQFDTVLEIAGLGGSLNRRVKAYSHGMQQRLAIAQAMLGLPEVLVLDEPANGLDPPQIAEMREVLHRYAATGRTVIISSHLLAEVEQTCSHVVVMHRGKLVAAGSVEEVAGGGGVQLVVDDPAHATNVLAAAGISARAVPVRRALEDVFLDLIGERHE